MTDVSFCEDGVGVGKMNAENAFFILEIFRATHRAGLDGGGAGLPAIPLSCAL
mgnify:CR=1 FL=1